MCVQSEMEKVADKIIEEIFQVVPALIVVLDANGKIVKFNTTCQKVTGYKEDEVVGKEIFDILIPPEQRQEVREVFHALKARGSPTNYINHWLTKSGERRLIAWHNSYMTDEQGNVVVVIGTGNDITDLVELKEQEKQTLKKLKILSDILLHDIRNHVASLEGYISLLEETKDFTIIVKLRKLIKSIFSLLENVQQQTKEPNKASLKPIKLSAMLNNITKHYATVGSTEISISGDAVVLADENLHSMFENLVQNSIKHGGTSKIEINILQDANSVIIEFLQCNQTTEENRQQIENKIKAHSETHATGLGIVGKLIEIYDATIKVTLTKDRYLSYRIVFPKPSL